MSPRNPDFEAIKEITRVSWLLGFEAVATAGNDDDALDFDLLG